MFVLSQRFHPHYPPGIPMERATQQHDKSSGFAGGFDAVIRLQHDCFLTTSIACGSGQMPIQKSD